MPSTAHVAGPTTPSREAVARLQAHHRSLGGRAEFTVDGELERVLEARHRARRSRPSLPEDSSARALRCSRRCAAGGVALCGLAGRRRRGRRQRFGVVDADNAHVSGPTTPSTRQPVARLQTAHRRLGFRPEFAVHSKPQRVLQALDRARRLVLRSGRFAGADSFAPRSPEPIRPSGRRAECGRGATVPTVRSAAGRSRLRPGASSDVRGEAALDPPCPRRAAVVCGPAMPSTGSPWLAWNLRTASSVSGPKTPSTLTPPSAACSSCTWRPSLPELSTIECSVVVAGSGSAAPRRGPLSAAGEARGRAHRERGERAYRDALGARAGRHEAAARLRACGRVSDRARAPTAARRRGRAGSAAPRQAEKRSPSAGRGAARPPARRHVRGVRSERSSEALQWSRTARSRGDPDIRGRPFSISVSMRLRG